MRNEPVLNVTNSEANPQENNLSSQFVDDLNKIITTESSNLASPTATLVDTGFDGYARARDSKGGSLLPEHSLADAWALVHQPHASASRIPAHEQFPTNHVPPAVPIPFSATGSALDMVRATAKSTPRVIGMSPALLLESPQLPTQAPFHHGVNVRQMRYTADSQWCDVLPSAGGVREQVLPRRNGHAMELEDFDVEVPVGVMVDHHEDKEVLGGGDDTHFLTAGNDRREANTDSRGSISEAADCVERKSATTHEAAADATADAPEPSVAREKDPVQDVSVAGHPVDLESLSDEQLRALVQKLDKSGKLQDYLENPGPQADSATTSSASGQLPKNRKGPPTDKSSHEFHCTYVDCESSHPTSSALR